MQGLAPIDPICCSRSVAYRHTCSVCFVCHLQHSGSIYCNSSYQSGFQLTYKAEYRYIRRILHSLWKITDSKLRDRVAQIVFSQLSWERKIAIFQSYYRGCCTIYGSCKEDGGKLVCCAQKCRMVAFSNAVHAKLNFACRLWLRRTAITLSPVPAWPVLCPQLVEQHAYTFGRTSCLLDLHTVAIMLLLLVMVWLLMEA